MIKNRIIAKNKIVKGKDYYMLRDTYFEQLEKLPKDILKNMVIKLSEENKELTKKNKQLKEYLDEGSCNGNELRKLLDSDWKNDVYTDEFN